MKKILLVEDDRRIRTALVARLRAAHYEVVAACDPVYATMMVAAHQPDLIIADIFMPVMKGLTFVRQLKGMGLHSPPVIFITASQQEGLWESAMRLGAAGFFEKPYDPNRLLATVAHTLAQSESNPRPRVGA
jgi:CheY-like chemotaxis protein